MIYVIIAIFCSVVVSINFKLFKRYDTSAYQAIVFNYPTAALLCFLFFKPDLSANPTLNNWIIFALIAVMLISIFYFIGKSISTSGIVITAIAQRLSLIIPVLAAFLIFHENATTLKIIGLIIGMVALYISKPQGKANYKEKATYYPLIVFLGTGVLDILFNFLTQLDSISFTTALFYVFVIATIIGFVSLYIQYLNKSLNFQLKAIFAGIGLGIFNFGSIYFYIKALQIERHQPSVVFSSLDIGVIFLGSVVGLLLFKEKLSRLNIIGLVMALIAIIILNLPNAV